MSLLFDPAAFPILRAAEEAVEPIRREMEAIPPEDYISWPARAAYSGDWRLFMFQFDYPDGEGVDFAANRARCPETMAFVREHPALISSGFSRLEPGTHISSHVDGKPDTYVRGHLGLSVPGRARFRVGNEIHRWQEGRALAFEGLIDHEVANADSEPRTLFIFDFTLSPDELAYAREVMARVPERYLVADGAAHEADREALLGLA